MLIIEADGYSVHGGRKAWVNDWRKRNVITGLGYKLIVTLESLLGSLPPLVVDLAPFFGRKLPSDGKLSPKKR